MSSPLTVGSTYRFLSGTILKDGAVWSLGNATVTLLLRRPGRSGGQINLAATAVTDGTNGQFQAVNAAGDLNVVGTWTRTWLVVDGSVVQYSVPIEFSVIAAP